MISMPETRYAKSGDMYIAYQVTGEGSRDLVLVPGFISHLDMQLEQPLYASFVARLASFCRLIRFDKRGTGRSVRLGAIPTLEERMDDVRAVMDAAGSTRAALLGFSEGGPMSIVFAATYPSGRASARDGDSVLIGQDKGTVDARLHGIDAPEWDQQCKDKQGEPWPCGQFAKKTLAGLVDGRELRCRVTDVGKWGGRRPLVSLRRQHQYQRGDAATGNGMGLRSIS